MIVAAENGELALEQSKEAPSANGPIGTGGLLLSSEAVDLLNKSSEGSLGTHSLASSPSASHITHSAPSTGISPPPPFQPGPEEPEMESQVRSMETESANVNEGLDDSSVDGPLLEGSCVDSPTTVGPSSCPVGGGEGGTGADAVHALSALSGGSVSHSPDDEQCQNYPEEVDAHTSLGIKGEEDAGASQSADDDSKKSDVESMDNSDPAVGHEAQGSESTEESVVVGMLTSSHDQDSSVCKDDGQVGSDQASDSKQVAEQDPCPSDISPADSFPIADPMGLSHTATESSLPGSGSDLPSVVITECSHSQRVSSLDLEDDVDEFFDAVSTPLPSPLDTSSEFDVGKSTGESALFEVTELSREEMAFDAAGLNKGETSFDVTEVDTEEVACDVAGLNSGETTFDVAGINTDKTFHDVAGVNTGETSTDGASAEVGSGKDEGRGEVDMVEGKGGVAGAFDTEGPGTEGKEKVDEDNRVEQGPGTEQKENDLETVSPDSTSDGLENPLEGAEPSTAVFDAKENEGGADAEIENLTMKSVKDQIPSELMDSGEGSDGENEARNLSTTDAGVASGVEGNGEPDTGGMHTQSSQDLTDTCMGDGSSATASSDSVAFSGEAPDEDSAGLSGVRDMGEVVVNINSDESSGGVGKDVCERKDGVTVSSENGEQGSEEPSVGVDTEGILQDVTDIKVTSEVGEVVVSQTDDLIKALNKDTGSDEKQTQSAFAAEIDETQPVSEPRIGSDDEQSAAVPNTEVDEEAPATAASTTKVDEQLVASASKTDSGTEHSGAETADLAEEQDGGPEQSTSGDLCQKVLEEKEAEAEPREPAHGKLCETDSAQDQVAPKEGQEESADSKETKDAESSDRPGESKVGTSKESEELPDTLSPLLDTRKALNRDLSEGGTSEDSEARLDDEKYDFDDIDEALADGSPVASKGKGGGQNPDDSNAEAAAEDTVSFGSRDSGLQESVCIKENEASQGDTASFGSRDSGLQESTPSKESEVSREDSASLKSRDSGSVAEGSASFLSEDSTTGTPGGAEGGAEVGAPKGIVGSRESLDLEARLDKMVSDDSSAQETPTKEKHKHKKSKKFKMFKKIFK